MFDEPLRPPSVRTSASTPFLVFNFIRKRRLLLLILAVVLFFVLRKGHPADRTPKEAAQSFATALKGGDMKTARVLSVGSEAQLTAAQEEVHAARFETSCFKRYGGFSEGNFSPFFNDPWRRLEGAEATINGAEARLIDRKGGKEREITELQKQGDGWKVVLPSASISFPGGISGWDDVIDSLCRRVDKGEFSSRKEAYVALGKEIEKRLAANPSPAPAGTEVGASASAWAEQYFDAPYISGSEFLREVHSVRLELVPNGDLLQRVDESTQTRIITKLLEQYGVRVDARSAVTLTVTAEARFIAQRTVDPDEGTVSVTDEAYSFFINADFNLRTACLRDGQFISVIVSPLNYGQLMANPGRNDGVVFAEKYEERLGIILKQFADDTNDQFSPHAVQAWQRSRWPANRDGAMQNAFLAACQHSTSGGNQTFVGINSMRPTTVALNAGASDHASASIYQQQWEYSCRQAGITVDPLAPFCCVHDIDSVEGNISSVGDLIGYSEASLLFTNNMSNVTLWQYNTVFSLNGKLRRRTCKIWSVHGVGLTMKPKTEAVLGNLASDGITDFFRQLRASR